MCFGAFSFFFSSPLEGDETDLVLIFFVPRCVDQEEISAIGDAVVTPLTRDEVRKQIVYKIQNPALDMNDRLHSISHCRLPRSRRLMQKRLNQA